MSTHAKRSPSKISRIIRCPGSPDFIRYLKQKKTIPEEETSPYADEGSMLHKQQELNLHGKPFTETLNAEQENVISENRDWFLSLYERHNLTWFQTERAVNLEGYGLSDAGGTADIVAGSGTRTLHILDWKFGKGIPVYVDKNEQLMDYLLGAAENLERLEQFEELWIHLGQPRFGYFESYQCNVKELMGLINAIKNSEKLHDIIAGEKQCFWCEGKPHCGTWAERNELMAITIFKVQDAMAKNEVPFKTMVKALALESEFKKVFKTIRDQFKVLSGPELAEIKMKRVAGRSDRAYTSEEQVVKYLCENYSNVEEIYTPPKLKSPAQIEKTIKGIKKDPQFQAFIHKPMGAPTIVSIHDKRLEYGNDAKSAFAHLASRK